MTFLKTTATALAFSGYASGVIGQGVSQLEAEIMSFMAASETEVSWGSKIEYDGLVVFSDILLERFGKQIRIEEMRYNGSQIGLVDIMVRNGADGGDGFIRGDVIEMSGLEGFQPIFKLIGAGPVAPQATDVVVTCSESVGSFVILNLAFVADGDGLPASLPGAERILIKQIDQTEIITRSGDTCSTETQSNLAGVTVLAVDGARVTASSISLDRQRAATLLTADFRSDDLVRVSDVKLISAGGTLSARADRVSFSAGFDDDLLSMIENVQNAAIGTRDNGAILAKALLTDAHVNLEIAGLEIDVRAFFPDHMIEPLGLDYVNLITGGFGFNLSAKDAVVRTAARVGLPGLIETSLEVSLGLPASLEAKLPGFIAARLPIPEVLLDVTVHKVAFAYRDEGIGDVASTVSGLRPEEHVIQAAGAIKERFGSRLPDVIMSSLDGIASTVSDVMISGGTILIAPEAPLTVMSIAMQSVMAPEGLVDAMRIIVSKGD